MRTNCSQSAAWNAKMRHAERRDGQAEDQGDSQPFPEVADLLVPRLLLPIPLGAGIGRDRRLWDVVAGISHDFA